MGKCSAQPPKERIKQQQVKGLALSLAFQALWWALMVGSPIVRRGKIEANFSQIDITSGLERMEVEQVPLSVPVLRGHMAKQKGSKVKPAAEVHRLQVSALRSHKVFTEKHGYRWEAKSGAKERTSCSEIDVFKQPGPNAHLKNLSEPTGNISSHWRLVKRLPKRWEKKNQGALSFPVYFINQKILDEIVTLLVSTVKMTGTSVLMNLSRTDVSNQSNVLLWAGTLPCALTQTGPCLTWSGQRGFVAVSHGTLIYMQLLQDGWKTCL